MQLRAGDETLSDNFRVFHSAEAGIPSANPTLIITYNRRPSIPTPLSPPDQAVVPSLRPELEVNPATDADPGDAATLKYLFRITDSPDAETGAKVAESAGFVDGTTFTPPAGALLDGVTYWWHAYVADATLYSAPDWVRSFRVDLGLGRDGVAPVDDAGPASVNLANGNLMVGHV